MFFLGRHLTSAISSHLLRKCRTGLWPAAVAGVICSDIPTNRTGGQDESQFEDRNVDTIEKQECTLKEKGPQIVGLAAKCASHGRSMVIGRNEQMERASGITVDEWQRSQQSEAMIQGIFGLRSSRAKWGLREQITSTSIGRLTRPRVCCRKHLVASNAPAVGVRCLLR